MKSITPTRLDKSPNRVQRNRQFSQIRLGHSNRVKTANIGTSRNTNNSVIEHTTPRQENKAKQNTNNKSQISTSPTKVVCVGCFNKQLSQAKINKKRQQDKAEHQKSVSLINADDQYHNQAKSRYLRQFQLTNKYNKEKMIHDKQKKQRQRLQKQRSVIEAEEQSQQNKQLQLKKAELQHERVEQLRRDLRQQIQKKKIKQSMDKNQQKEPIQSIFDQPKRRDIQQQMQQKYKRELKDQIQQNKRRRQQQQQDDARKKKEEQIQILQEVAQKQRLKKQQIERRQKMIDEQNKKRKQMQQLKQKKRKQQQIQQQIQTKNKITSFLEQKKMQQQLRRKKIDKYVEDIKKQMNVDLDKKKKQYAWLHQPTRIALIQKQEVPQRTCDSCEKKYPESYLTKIQQPLKF